MTIAEMIPSWTTTGIFSRIVPLMDWTTSPTSLATSLDIAYIGRSGDKEVAPIVKRFIDDDGTISDTSINAIISSIIAVYGENWKRLYTALESEYNPINNYEMVETTTPRVVTTTSIDATNGVYGFNSNVSVPTNDADNTTTVSQTGENTLTRSGNIGVTTSQQMLESEYELRKKHYFNAVFSDLDNFLTLKIY